MIDLDNLPENLNRNAASQYLMQKHGISRRPKTLAKLACIGGGPKFRKDGRFPVYPVTLLDEYAREQLGSVVGSNAEAKEVA
jgi:hypothetical protein